MATPEGPNPSLPTSDGLIKTKFEVGMTCEGCASAVKRILTKVEGVSNITTSVADKTVFVESTGEVATAAFMLEKLEKWGAAAGKTVKLSASQ